MDQTQKKRPGIWLGIDLGTTNTTAAFYSPSKHVSKLIRFSPTFVQQRNDKFGRILPSAVYFEKGQLASVGKSALLMTNNIQNGHGEDQSEGYLLTSVKRIWGMDKVQIQDVMTQDESFMTSCPFQTMWVDDELQIIVDNTNKKNDQSSTIPPIQVAEILLRTIRDQAKEYLIRERRRKKHYPLGLEQQFNIQGINDSTDYNIINCVITIPAHFSRNQRDKMIQAARNAGFEGHVSTLVESTAAAMAYGLFVSPTKIVPNRSNNSNSDQRERTKIEGRRIICVDMGGGTTDITIADMTSANNKTNNDGHDTSFNKNEPSFKVLTTVGERRLGGDDMDDALAQYVLKEKIKEQPQTDLSKRDWNALRMSCRIAKEDLSGDGKDVLPKKETTMNYFKKEEITITRQEFNGIIQHLVDRVSRLVEKGLNSCQCTCESIDEVILVGGATRTPAIRTMLQAKFQKNELCYSIDPDAAVVQGAAIQSAIISGLVPKHELRNALMLDALPHTIGVLVSMGVENETYIPILESGMALPAMNYASFKLADIYQKGVTIVAVEDVGDDLPLQRIGEFNFLLHRLSRKQLISLDNGERTIDVGMTVDADARFIVSVFDRNDPDDLKKKERYQQWKLKSKKDNDEQEYVYTLRDNEKDQTGMKHEWRTEEILLFFCSIFLVILWFVAHLLFDEPTQDGSKIL